MGSAFALDIPDAICTSPPFVIRTLASEKPIFPIGNEKTPPAEKRQTAYLTMETKP